MKKHIFLFATITSSLLYSYCGNNNSSTNVPADNTASSTTRSGKEIFEQVCIVCHGKDGKANISGAAFLNKSTISLDSCISVIKHGRGNMPANQITKDEEIKAVAEYIQTLRTE